MFIISIDIGSTWTKGGLFRCHEGFVYPVITSCHKTTVCDLVSGFDSVLDKLKAHAGTHGEEGDIPVVYSSSAKGGLSVAAIGLVPNLTLETAKLAAYSAGARVDQCYAYHLSNSDIEELEESTPDILLLAGGTDGGNSEYVLRNAQALAKCGLDCPIIYAGNRSLVDQVNEVLSHKELHIVGNILPQMNEPALEPVREKIRSIFVNKIIEGKGLDKIAQAIGSTPLPTPYVVHDLVRHISENVTGWDNFMLIDLGGATTDVYSQCIDSPEFAVVYRGLIEPELKRTVEGDLGMRVSADSTVEKLLNGTHLDKSLSEVNTNRFLHYVQEIKQDADYISTGGEHAAYDSHLAECCIANAVTRHAGRRFDVHTADGPVKVQIGRNLNIVKKLVGSGGYLSNNSGFDVAGAISKSGVDEKGQQILLPSEAEYFCDEQYLIPLFANIARLYPEQAAKGAVAHFELIESHQAKSQKLAAFS